MSVGTERFAAGGGRKRVVFLLLNEPSFLNCIVSMLTRHALAKKTRARIQLSSTVPGTKEPGACVSLLEGRHPLAMTAQQVWAKVAPHATVTGGRDRKTFSLASVIQCLPLDCITLNYMSRVFCEHAFVSFQLTSSRCMSHCFPSQCTQNPARMLCLHAHSADNVSAQDREKPSHTFIFR